MKYKSLHIDNLEIEKVLDKPKSMPMEFVAKDGSYYYIKGYANTKGVADAYGDIPTNYKGQPIYMLNRMKLNPILLLDHNNSASSIVGSFVNLDEDEYGLRFKACLRPLETVHNDKVADAISSVIYGFSRSFSIAGKFLFEDKENPTHLTKAYIHEISLVGVPADAYAVLDRYQNNEANQPQEQAREEADMRLSYIKERYNER